MTFFEWNQEFVNTMQVIGAVCMMLSLVVALGLYIRVTYLQKLVDHILKTTYNHEARLASLEHDLKAIFYATPYQKDGEEDERTPGNDQATLGDTVSIG